MSKPSTLRVVLDRFKKASEGYTKGELTNALKGRPKSEIQNSLKALHSDGIIRRAKRVRDFQAVWIHKKFPEDPPLRKMGFKRKIDESAGIKPGATIQNTHGANGIITKVWPTKIRVKWASGFIRSISSENLKNYRITPSENPSQPDP